MAVGKLKINYKAQK